MDDLIYKAYEGREKLWIVYWIYGFIGAPLFVLIMTVVFVFAPSPFMFIAYLWFIGAYLFWVTVSVYRCKNNCENKKLVWGIILGFQITLYVLAAITGFSFSPAIISFIGTMASI